MKHIFFITVFILILSNVAFASLRDDLFDDYDIYSHDVEKVIKKTKKEVFNDIDDIKDELLKNNYNSAKNKINAIHNNISQLDSYIKDSYKKLKTKNMKDALTYPVLELSFYEKVIGEIMAYYEKNGVISKKEIKNIEKKFKEEEKAIKKKASDIRSEFLSAVFD